MDMMHLRAISVDDVDSLIPELGSTNTSLIEDIAFNGEMMNRDLITVSEVITKVELDLACSSEKLVNLSVLMMHVGTRESDFESFASEKEPLTDDSAERAMEFDLLLGILDSEINELENLMRSLQTEIQNARDTILSLQNPDVAFLEMEEKLHDAETSLRQSQDQVAEMKIQSANFQRIISGVGGDGSWNGKQGSDFPQDGEVLNMNAKIKMQTAEQQRHFLRMFEKSLAREMELEKKLTESKQMQEELRMKLLSAKQDVFYMEEEMEDSCLKCFEAENVAQVLTGISKELLGKLQILQFNLNGAVKREKELKSELVGSKEQSEHVIEELKEKLTKAETRAAAAETKCKLLSETNMELDEELGIFKSKGFTLEKLESLQKQLKDSDIQLQHAIASVEASQEKQSMLYSTISDMNNLIEDLKMKVLKAENRADNAEDKLIVVSESNAELNDELGYLTGRLKSLEQSLHQAEEIKMQTAKEIALRTEIMTNLVMQLAVERERLHKQVSTLSMENSILVVKLKQTEKSQSLVNDHGSGKKGEEISSLEQDQSAESSIKENGSQATGVSAANFKADAKKIEMASETELRNAESNSDLDTVRRLDIGALSFKHIVCAVVLVLVSGAAYHLLQ